jgi:hypothetical protein
LPIYLLLHSEHLFLASVALDSSFQRESREIFFKVHCGMIRQGPLLVFKPYRDFFDLSIELFLSVNARVTLTVAVSRSASCQFVSL